MNGIRVGAAEEASGQAEYIGDDDDEEVVSVEVSISRPGEHACWMEHQRVELRVTTSCDAQAHFHCCHWCMMYACSRLQLPLISVEEDINVILPARRRSVYHISSSENRPRDRGGGDKTTPCNVCVYFEAYYIGSKLD